MGFKTVSLRATCIAASLSAFACISVASAEGFKLPDNYLSRFAATSPVLDPSYGYGLRGLPLPIEPDVKLNVVYAAAYKQWEYALTGSFGTASYFAGIAPYGALKFSVNSDPANGLQYGAMYQGDSWSSGTQYSNAYLGYSKTFDQDKITLKGNAGVATQDVCFATTGGTAATASADCSSPSTKTRINILAPYLQAQANAYYSFPIQSDAVKNASYFINPLVNVYYYPVQGKAQAYGAVNIGATAEVYKGLTLAASHYSRLAVGESAVPGLNIGNYHGTDASLTYRIQDIPKDNMLGVGALRTRVHHDWLDGANMGNTYIYGDLLFKIADFGTFMGPYVGYKIMQDGTQNGITFGFSTMSR